MSLTIDNATMATINSSPVLAIVTDNALTTWRCLTESQPSIFYPHGDVPISDVAWNHNGQVLASCSAISTDEQLHNTVILTAAQTGSRLDSFQHNQQWKRAAGTTNSVAFGGKSRYLCIGDESGAVCLWDLKKRLRVRQFFHDGHPSRQVSLDPTDNYILSLSSKLLSIYNLREGTGEGTFTPPSNGTLSFTRYHTSALEPHITAVGTTDGSILLYDITNTRDRSTPFFSLDRGRQSNISGVAFSPTNYKFLASTSTDGTVMFWDKNSGEIIGQLASSKNGIQALTMHSDGISFAVGTETGHVLMYDLRQTEAPLTSMYVQGPVTSLQFSPPPKNKPGQTNNNSSPLANRQEIKELRNDIEMLEGQQQQLTTNYSSGLYSTKAISSQQSIGQQSETTQGNQQSYAGPPSTTNMNPMMKSPMHPVMMSSQKSTAEQSESTYQNNHSYMGPPSSTTTTTKPLAPQKVVTPQKTMPPQEKPAAPFARPQQTPPSTTKAAIPERPRPQHPINNSTLYNSALFSAAKDNSEEKKASEPNIDVEEVRDLVREEVENLRDDLEESIRNLHMDMISQFHLQSQEVNSALSTQLVTIDRLTEENQRLRDENDRLKEGYNSEM